MRKKGGVFKKITSVLVALLMVLSTIAISPIKANAATPKGYITVSVERFTLGLGYLIEPVKVPFYSGDNGAKILTRLLDDYGLEYRNTGKVDDTSGLVGSTFYLSYIRDDESKKAQIPKYITDQIKKLYKLKDVMTIYNPVDTSKFVPNKENHDKFTFITIGRMSPQKNQALLLKSFSNIVNYDKNVSLIFIGDGELKEELFALTKQLNIENYVKYIGNVSKVECFLNKADVFVLSSIYEGLPMTILEAMSIGLPIISTNVGGVKDVVTDNGLLVGVNENELTEAMELIMHSKEKYNYFANNSKKNAKNFNLEKIAEEYEKVYFNHLKRKEVKGK